MTSTRSSPEERRNSPFHRVFWWSMGYNRVVTIFYTLFLLGMLPVGVLLSIITNQTYYTDPSNWTDTTPEQVAAYYGDTIRQSFNVQLTSLVIPLAVLFLLVWCARNFGYMQGRRSVDLFHALPVRRTPLFMGIYLAGLVSTLLPLALSVGVTQLLCSVHAVKGVMGNPLLYWEAFGVIALPLTAAMTLTVFFMVVSGNPLNWFLMTAATAFGWPVTVLCADLTMSAFLPGYVSNLSTTFYTVLCPYFAPYAIIPNGVSYMLFSLTEDGSTIGEAMDLYTIPLPYVLWWLGFSLALLGLTVFYYARRKSECAENPFSFPAARGAVRSLITIGGALGLGIVVGTLLNSNVAYAVGLVVGAVVAHTVYQGVITRGFQRFWTTIPAFVLTCALLAGGLYSLYTGGLGYVTRVPNADQVKSAEFSLPDVPGNGSMKSYLAVSSYYNLSLVNAKGDWDIVLSPSFEQQGDLETLTRLHQAATQRYPGPYLPFGKKSDYRASNSLSITYTLKDGRTMKRNYMDLPLYSDDETLLSALADVQETDTMQNYIPFYSTTPKRVISISVYEDDGRTSYSADNSRLTLEEKEKLWQTFVEELNSKEFSNPASLLTEAESLELLAQQEKSSEEGSASGDGNYTGTERSYTLYVGRIPTSELKPETAALLEGKESTSTDDNGVKIPLRGIDGGSYTVPKCCTKTRALIDELTEPYGEYTNYEDDEEMDADSSAPAVPDDGWLEGDWSDASGVVGESQEAVG